jgi:hypothetical protein
MLAMMLLVLHAVGAWCYSVLGMAGAIASTLLVVAVSLLADHMARAGRGSIAWFVVPTLAFTALPLAARLWTVVQAEQGWWQRTVALAPFVIGFAAPVHPPCGASTPHFACSTTFLARRAGHGKASS